MSGATVTITESIDNFQTEEYTFPLRSDFEDDYYEDDEQDFDIMTDEETTDADQEEHQDDIHPDMVK